MLLLSSFVALRALLKQLKGVASSKLAAFSVYSPFSFEYPSIKVKRYTHQFRGICICLACTPPAYQGQVLFHHATQLALSRAFQLMRGVEKPML